MPETGPRKAPEIPATMAAVQLTGYGGLDRLVYRTDVPTPRPEPGEVLIRVTAAGMNNTDINARTGWYNADVKTGTTADGGTAGFGVTEAGMGDWEGGLGFPRIQGADCVGRIVAVGDGVDPRRIGERVIVEPYLVDPDDAEGLESAGFLGLEYDGAFAQFTAFPARNVHKLPEGLAVSDTALATLPCSGGTAMNMLVLAGAKAGDLALVTGASGGVGSFLVQILKHLGAEVVAVCGRSKFEAVRALGAHHVVDRNAPSLEDAVLAETGGRKLTLVADVVGGAQFPAMLALLRRGGRYVTAGAIAGPEVTLDLRTLYLKSLTFYGSTVYRPETFPRLLEIVAEGGIEPAVAETRPLSEIREAQTRFLEKTHIGSLVLIPPDGDGARPSVTSR